MGIVPTRGSILSLAVIILMVISILPITASALDVSSWTTLSDTGKNSFLPRIDVDSNGNFHMVYVTDTDDGDDTLIYRKVDPSGTTLVGPLDITPRDTNFIVSPAINVDSMDRTHVACGVDSLSSASRDIHYTQISKEGVVTIEKEAYVDSDDVFALDLENDASGNTYIVWCHYSDPLEVMWMKLSLSGSIIGSPKAISDELGFGGMLINPRLGASPTGDTYISWEQKDNQAARWSIYYSQLTPTGTVEVDPVKVITYYVERNLDFDATCDNDGNLHIIYVQNTGISRTVVDIDGNIDREDVISSSPLGLADMPDIAIDDNDNIYVAFRAQNNMVTDPLHPFLCIWDHDDESWSDPEELYLGTDSSEGPHVAAGNGLAGVVTPFNGVIRMVTVGGEINQPPVPVLSAYPTQAEINEDIGFDGMDSYDPDADRITDYYFEFGDGASTGWISSSSTLHSYETAGTFTASLRVRDYQGIESTSTDTVTIQVSAEPINKPPTAVLTANPTTVDSNKDVTFSGGGSSDSDGSVAEYQFNFGDGVITEWVSTSTVIHSYASEGVVTATLWVRDDEGLQSENFGSARISVVHTNDAPTATISDISPNPAMFGQDITFTGTATDTDGTIETYTWESNLDGPIGSAATFTISVITVGTHTITFKVRDDSGDWSEEASTSLVVKANSPFTIEDMTNVPDQPYTDTLIEFRVIYTDPDNDRPTKMNLLYSKLDGDWKEIALVEVDSGDKDYNDGKEYFYNKKFTDSGKWKYSFEFENSKNNKKSTQSIEIEVKEPPGLFPAWEASLVIIAMSIVSLGMRNSKRRRTRLLK